MRKTPGRPARPGRSRRRVDAPATNPDADPGDDVSAAAGDDRARGARPVADPREDWIVEQRPPHWD
ncbi:hypothetical protein [Ornithinimicrobium pratense]|uniref:Uncharacterized protein n=1 Tax=Ornithinimicrobium pratense TaxID=2593973 RepID=A0A5J6V3E9_9MICO|nr:hypothetical protein [Ornithinimicrobium pratense]QFG67702.1 hypothetical protein FY030_02255 [Ornithinimicrobium pratense]